jgi:hypothetical protein
MFFYIWRCFAPQIAEFSTYLRGYGGTDTSQDGTPREQSCPDPQARRDIAAGPSPLIIAAVSA